MFNIGPMELVTISVVALVVFGPEKLPKLTRQAGGALAELRRIQWSLQDQVYDVINDDAKGRSDHYDDFDDLENYDDYDDVALEGAADEEHDGVPAPAHGREA